MVKSQAVGLLLIILDYIVEQLVLDHRVTTVRYYSISWHLGEVRHLEDIVLALQACDFHQILVLGSIDVVS